VLTFKKYCLQQTKFNLRFGRSSNLDELRKRFIDRFNFIEEHNASNSTYKLQINKFAHFTSEELAQRTGYAFEPQAADEGYSGKTGRIFTPDSFDYRLQSNILGPVQDQGYCASSWAFVAVEAIETQMKRRRIPSVKLSEQEILDCVSNYCSAYTSAYAYNFAKNRGLTSAANNPYAYFNGYVSRTCNAAVRPRVQGSSLRGYLNVPAAEDQIRSYLVQYGPIAASIYVPDDLYFYSSGVFTDTWNQCGSMGGNHAVLIVGYGTENNEEFWIIKNTWGKTTKAFKIK
jgi:C1A family cysteine protease